MSLGMYALLMGKPAPYRRPAKWVIPETQMDFDRAMFRLPIVGQVELFQ